MIQALESSNLLNGCCNHHGSPAKRGFGKRSQKPEVHPLNFDFAPSGPNTAEVEKAAK
ncbi:hypothetical protein N9357_00250 [bacterium]|nr:hypothetical protein [bacterium]